MRAALLLALVACAPSAWVRSELYFGAARPGGDTVSADEFREFTEKEVLRRFPAGFTLLEGRGQWQGDGGPVSEKSRVLVVLHPRSAEAEAFLESLREAYKKQFSQESVLRVDQDAAVSF